MLIGGLILNCDECTFVLTIVSQSGSTVVHWLTHTVLHASINYRVPFVEPFPIAEALVNRMAAFESR